MGSGRSDSYSLAGYHGQCGDTDSDSFQVPNQPGNRSSVLLVLGKSACANLIDLVESACVGLDCPSRGWNCRFTLVIECILEKDAGSRLVCPR